MITIRQMEFGDCNVASHLVQTVFDEHIARHYVSEGVATFRRFTNPEGISSLLEEGGCGFVAMESEVMGVLMLFEESHIALLFVATKRHGFGVGRRLVNAAVDFCKNEVGSHELTVNASPNSVKFYEKMGFRSTRPERERDGIRFTPMQLLI